MKKIGKKEGKGEGKSPPAELRSSCRSIDSANLDFNNLFRSVMEKVIDCRVNRSSCCRSGYQPFSMIGYRESNKYSFSGRDCEAVF